MNSYNELLFLAIAALIGAIFSAIIVYFVIRRNSANTIDESTAIDVETTRVRLETGLANAQQQVNEKNRVILEKEAEVREITERLNKCQTDLEVVIERLRSNGAENEKLASRQVEIESELTSLTRSLAQSQANERILAESRDSHLSTNNEIEAEITSLRRQNQSVTNENATLRANFEALEERLRTNKAEIEEIRQKSHAEFENIANRLLESKSAKFTESNRENIENILSPLKADINLFKTKVEETYEKESQQRFSLEREVRALIEQTDKVSAEANNLATALKGSSKTQGNWGEMILERILETNGLVRGREYDVQHSVRGDEGNQQFLDVIVHLPDNRNLIIDSKVTLVAYERYCSSETDEERSRFLKEHLRSLANHIEQLSGKKYDDLESSPDFVFLFVPIEPAYLMAVQNDSEMWSRAYEKRILLISPTNLMAAVKMVSDLWKRDQQSRNAQEIAKQGEKLYEKFVGFLKSMEDVGSSITKTQESYTKAIKQLKEGNGNLIGQAEKLKQLGVRSAKMLPAVMSNFDVDYTAPPIPLLSEQAVIDLTPGPIIDVADNEDDVVNE